MRFFDYSEKAMIFKNCAKLKGSDISIANDLSQTTLQKQRKLWESAKEERARGLKVKLVRDKITIEKETFVWDDAKDCRVKLDKKNSQKDDSD